MSDAFYLTKRNIDEQREINNRVRRLLRVGQVDDPRNHAQILPRIFIAQADIANNASGNAVFAKGPLTALVAATNVVSVFNLTGATIPNGAKFVGTRVAVEESGGSGWVAMLGAAPVIERVYTGTTVNAIAAESSGNVTPDSVGTGGEGGSAVSCKLEAAHGGEGIDAGKSVIYVKRVDGTRLIIAAECNTVTPPPPPTPPTLTSLSPADGATGVSPTMSMSWTSDGNAWDVWFGLTGNLFKYNASSTSFDPPGSLASGTYIWQVIAYNAAGGQTIGPARSFTV